MILACPLGVGELVEPHNSHLWTPAGGICIVIIDLGQGLFNARERFGLPRLGLLVIRD